MSDVTAYALIDLKTGEIDISSITPIHTDDYFDPEKIVRQNNPVVKKFIESDRYGIVNIEINCVEDNSLIRKYSDKEVDMTKMEDDEYDSDFYKTNKIFYQVRPAGELFSEIRSNEVNEMISKIKSELGEEVYKERMEKVRLQVIKEMREHTDKMND